MSTLKIGGEQLRLALTCYKMRVESTAVRLRAKLYKCILFLGIII